VVAWTVDVPAPPVTAPVIGGRRVYVALQPDVIAARSLLDGSELWTTKVAVEGPLAASDNVLVVTTRTEMHALDAATGYPAWTVPVGPLTAPPLVAGGWVIAASPGKLTAIRETDGSIVWSHDFSAVESRPSAEGESLYVSTVDGRVIALTLATGAPIWEAPVGPQPAQPLATADRVYVGTASRHFVCLRASTGKEDWRWPIGAQIRGAAVADETQVYLVAMDNLIWALHRTNGAAKWKSDLKYRPGMGPIVIGSGVTVPGRTAELKVFDVKNGRPAGQVTFPHELPLAPAFLITPGGAAMIVAIVGSPEGKWSLIAAVQPTPAILEAPLSVLPGTLVPLRTF
jgi:outer membrane protein assembly factor BamB